MSSGRKHFGEKMIVQLERAGESLSIYVYCFFSERLSVYLWTSCTKRILRKKASARHSHMWKFIRIVYFEKTHINCIK